MAIIWILPYSIFIILLNTVEVTYSLPTLVTQWKAYPNERPIIGVLSQEHYNGTPGVNATHQYIAASYVKFIEAGGARVVPIHIGNNQSNYIEHLLDSINGVLIPGGSASLTDSLYAQNGQKILKYAQEKNDAKDYFPIWATCLGFELLATLLAPGYDLLVNCSAHDLALPLNFTDGATDGRLFNELPTDVYQALLNENVTANYHGKCLTPEGVSSSGLSGIVKVLSTNKDANGLEFVSTYEVIKYPFYAVQWHPEKNAWEWNTDEKNIPHSPDAIRVTQYFSTFFTNEARKNLHKYANPAEETQNLIYSMKPDYSGKTGSDFEQIYDWNLGVMNKTPDKDANHAIQATDSVGNQTYGNMASLTTNTAAYPVRVNNGGQLHSLCSTLLVMYHILLVTY